MKQSTATVAIVGVLVGLAAGVAATLIVTRATAPQAPAVAQPAPQAAPQPGPGPLAPPQQAQQVEDPKAVYKVPIEDSPVRGGKNALVTVVISSDFECPFCKRVEPTLKQMADTYGDKIRFVFKQNPLAMHANARPAAKLVEEARAQGGDAQFWRVHDELFVAATLDRASLEAIAQKAKLDMGKVKEALDTEKHTPRLQRDQNLVAALGAHGTPAFFINGRKIVGARPFGDFKVVIDEELAKAEALVKSGVAAKDVYAKIIEKGATARVMVAGGAAAPADVVKVPLRADDPVRGAKVAPVTLVLFSDFQCPFCSRVGPTVKQILDAYGEKVRVVWKHQPLPFHPHALPAAKAAEAARAGGKFWEMHDKLFENQQTLSDAIYAQLAKELKLDAGRFQKEVAADATARRIAEDQQLAGQVGASGTPTLFVNCRKVVGARPFGDFKQLIDEELKRADGLKAKGEKLDAGFYDKICAANVAGILAAR